MTSNGIERFKECIPAVQNRLGDLKEKLQEILAVINQGKLVPDSMVESAAESLKACREKESELRSVAMELDIRVDDCTFEEIMEMMETVEKAKNLSVIREVIFDYFRLTTTAQDTLEALEESKKELQKVCRLIGDGFADAFRPYSRAVELTKTQEEVPESDFDLLFDKLGKQIARAVDKKKLEIKANADIACWLDGSVELLTKPEDGEAPSVKNESIFGKSADSTANEAEAQVPASETEATESDSGNELETETTENRVEQTETSEVEEIVEAEKAKTESKTAEENKAEEYIHPRNPIKDTKAPSDSKVKELITSTGDVLRYLLEKMTFTGFLDEADLVATMGCLPSHPISEESCAAAIALLERKGYVSVYPYKDRNVFCFNPLMRECLRKTSLKDTFKRLFKLKRISDICVCAMQDMPLSLFENHLSLVDMHNAMIDKLNDDPESIAILKTSNWNNEAKYFSLNLTRPDQKDLILKIVQQDNFAFAEMPEGEGIITYSETLPMISVEDNLHYCLTPKGLYNWSEGKWTAITHVEEVLSSVDSEEEETVREESNTETAEEKTKASVQSQNEETKEQPADIDNSDTGSVIVDEDDPEADDSSEKEIVSEKDNGKTDGFTAVYEEDLTQYGIVKGMDPAAIAGKILDLCIVPEHVNVFMCMIESLIEDGTSICAGDHIHNTLAQALVLLKALAPFDAVYADKLERLAYAVDSTIVPRHYTGREIVRVFESETAFIQDHPVEKLMTVIRAMLAPDSPHDYDLNGYADSLFSSYDSTFPGLEILKPLYNHLLKVKKYSPNGFSLQILRRAEDKQIEKQMQSVLVAKANELLVVPAAGNGFIAMPLMMARCFDSESTLGACLKVIAEDRREDRAFVEFAYHDEFCNRVGNEYVLSEDKIDHYFRTNWEVVLTQYRKVQDLNASQTKKVYANIQERLDTIRQWLDLTDEGGTDKNSMGQLIGLKKEILLELDRIASQMSKLNRYDRTIVNAGIEVIRMRLTSAQIVRMNEFNDFLRNGYVMLSDNGMPVIEESNELKDPFPTWRNVLHHVCAPVISLNETLQSISVKNCIPLYDNIGQAIQICRFIGHDASLYSADLSNAEASANKVVDEFKGELELAFAYGRLSEDEKEDILEELQYGTDIYYVNHYYGTLRYYLDALRAVIAEATSCREESITQDIQQRLKSDSSNALKELLFKAQEKVKKPQQNFVVAEEYINRFDAGTADEMDLHDTTGSNAFIDFISNNTFGPLYDLCRNNPSNALSGFGKNYVLEKLRQKNVSQQYLESSSSLISSFPNRPETGVQIIVGLLNELGFEATGGTKKSLISKGNTVVGYEIVVKPDSKDKAEYSHPVDIMGTNLQSPVDVICLFGRLQPNSIVSTVCNLELGHTAIVLLNGAVDIKARRQIAEIFHGEKSGQNPFILIDWVLMLHLAMHQKTERLAIMLSCTLPYTSSFQPFVAKGSVPDEMFIGRKKELRQILDPNGVSVVYGGRQLGKTALLERAQSLASKPARSEYAVLLRAADYSIEEEVTEESLVDAILRKLGEVGLTLSGSITSMKHLYDELLKMYRHNTWRKLLLLIDEADIMLDCFRKMKPTYRPIIALSDLSRETRSNFKFVLAGLHNVCRAANDPNTVFGQLGSPLCIKPLSSADALELLSRPLSYLGFSVDPEHLEHILVNTSFYPGIVHYVGYSLVENLTTKYSDYYRALNNNPPYDLTDRQLGEIMSSGELNKKIDERINWTLDADPRYLMLACCIAYLYLNEPEHNKSGHSVDMILLCAEMFDIDIITSLKQPDVLGLLDELVEMGILVKPTANTFRFRQRRFLDAIGTSDDKIQAKIENRMRG